MGWLHLNPLGLVLLLRLDRVLLLLATLFAALPLPPKNPVPLLLLRQRPTFSSSPSSALLLRTMFCEQSAISSWMVMHSWFEPSIWLFTLCPALLTSLIAAFTATGSREQSARFPCSVIQLIAPCTTECEPGRVCCFLAVLRRLVRLLVRLFALANEAIFKTSFCDLRGFRVVRRAFLLFVLLPRCRQRAWGFPFRDLHHCLRQEARSLALAKDRHEPSGRSLTWRTGLPIHG